MRRWAPPSNRVSTARRRRATSRTRPAPRPRHRPPRPAGGQRLQPPNAEGFHDIEQAKERETREQQRPWRRDTQQGSPAQETEWHHDEFVEDDLARICFPQPYLRFATNADRDVTHERSRHQDGA